MASLKVIPVIDILNGIAVHAIRGKRNEYKPLESMLSPSVNPVEVAKAYQTLGFSELYVADLDAITRSAINSQIIKDIVDRTGLRLMVDAGITDFEMAKQLLDSGVSMVVIGTETLEKKGFVGEAVKLFGSDRIIVSLDMKGDEVLVKGGFDGCKEPLCLLHEFKQLGVSSVIVLDLARVGSNEGVNVDFLKRVIAEISIDVYVGGGVRDIGDLFELKDLGVTGVLVATALHSGKITVESLKHISLL